jgi:hypothetical protein
MTLRPVVFLGLASALLAACNNSDDAAPEQEVAAPAPVLTPAPRATAAPDGTALQASSWNVNESAEGGSATFGEAATEPRLAINCQAATGTLTLSMAGTADGPQAWRLDAGGEAARIDMAPTDGELAQMTAEIEGSLAIFHAFSTVGEIVTLTSPEGERMQFPTHPGISRVLDACS